MVIRLSFLFLEMFSPHLKAWTLPNLVLRQKRSWEAAKAKRPNSWKLRPFAPFFVSPFFLRPIPFAFLSSLEHKIPFFVSSFQKLHCSKNLFLHVKARFRVGINNLSISHSQIDSAMPETLFLRRHTFHLNQIMEPSSFAPSKEARFAQRTLREPSFDDKGRGCLEIHAGSVCFDTVFRNLEKWRAVKMRMNF